MHFREGLVREQQYTADAMNGVDHLARWATVP